MHGSPWLFLVLLNPKVDSTLGGDRCPDSGTCPGRLTNPTDLVDRLSHLREPREADRDRDRDRTLFRLGEWEEENDKPSSLNSVSTSTSTTILSPSLSRS